MKAGRNTPQSVLRYIDAIWEQNTPPDPLVLAHELGYSPTAFRKLKERHGDGLGRYLLRVKRQRSDEPRFMAIQAGRYHPEQYVSSPQGAIENDEALDDDSLDLFSKRARAIEQDKANEVIGAALACKSAIAERAANSREFRILAGRTIARMNTEIDRFVERQRRRAA